MSKTEQTAPPASSPRIVRRCGRSLIVPFAAGLLIAVLGVAVAASTDLLNLPVHVGDTTVELPLFLLLFLVCITRPMFLLLDQHCEISEFHLRFSSGRCSLRRNDITIPFEDLRGVKVEQSVLQRLLGIGTVITWTRGVDTPEVRIVGVLHPHEISNLIAARIDRALIARKEMGGQRE